MAKPKKDLKQIGPGKTSTKKFLIWFNKTKNWIKTDFQGWIKKNIVLAVILTALSLWITTANNARLEKEWNEINLARISISDAKFFSFRAVSIEDYVDDSLQGIKDPADMDNNPNSIAIKNLIVAYDRAEKKNVPYTFGITMDELSKDLKSKKKVDTQNFDYQKLFRPQFTIQNVGQTPCTVDFIYLHDILIDTTNYTQLPNNVREQTLQQQNFILEPSQKSISSEFTFNIALQAPIPKFEFKCDVYYRDKNLDTLSKKVIIRSQNGEFWIQDVYDSRKVVTYTWVQRIWGNIKNWF